MNRVFNKTKLAVYNRGKPPDSFLNELIDFVQAAMVKSPEIFAKNDVYDIFSSIRPQLGPWTDDTTRAAAFAEAMRVLAGLESSWDWQCGRDTSNASSNTPFTEEAGIFQCSANSMYFDVSLQVLFEHVSGLKYSSNSAAVGHAFIALSKSNHAYALEHAFRLLRFTVNHHGPVKRKEINSHLSRESMAEIKGFLLGQTAVGDNITVVVNKAFPPRPRSYDEVRAIFGQPGQESNLAFCELDPAFIAFPAIKSEGNKRGLTCHKLLVPVFQAIFNDIKQAKLVDKVYSYDGCYNYRPIQGSSNLSFHSWGIAIDLNYDGNELGNEHGTMDKAVVAIFKKYGFFWGGDYNGRKDPMHFEYFDRS